MPGAPSISVLIPTRGTRGPLLQRQLAALAPQIRSDDQVLVSFDGQPECRVAIPAGFDTVTGPATGPAGARNRALRVANRELILFLNDDVLPAPDLLDLHRQAHTSSPALILGNAPWAIPTDDTPLDRLLRDTSLIFFYDQMKDANPDRDWGFRHAWTLNLSLPRSICARFDERLRYPMLDDLDWAFRVCRSTNAPVRYEPNAIATHEHRYTPDQLLAREVLLGHQSVQLHTINPACAAATFGVALITSDPSTDEIVQAATAFQHFRDWCRSDSTDTAGAFQAARRWRLTARRFGAARAHLQLEQARDAALAWAAQPLQRTA